MFCGCCNFCNNHFFIQLTCFKYFFKVAANTRFVNTKQLSHCLLGNPYCFIFYQSADCYIVFFRSVQYHFHLLRNICFHIKPPFPNYNTSDFFEQESLFQHKSVSIFTPRFKKKQFIFPWIIIHFHTILFGKIIRQRIYPGKPSCKYKLLLFANKRLI